MTLDAIVRARGGDIWNRGTEALIPAPGHGRLNRSVSLKIGDYGKVIVNPMGGACWKEVMDSLRDDNLVDYWGYPIGCGSSGRNPSETVAPAPTSDPQRIAAAMRHWIGGVRLGDRTLGAKYLRGRKIVRPLPNDAVMRFNRTTPVSAYREGCSTAPAIVWAITDSHGEFTGVEVTFLAPDGRRATRMKLSRKTVGVMRAGSAIRLDEPCAEMLVGEGVPTTLSATERFELPGWALGSIRNLRRWTPPPGVRSVLIAGDNGREGQEAAHYLADALRSRGVAARPVFPDPDFQDWNDVATGKTGTAKESARLERTPAPALRE